MVWKNNLTLSFLCKPGVTHSTPTALACERILIYQRYDFFLQCQGVPTVGNATQYVSDMCIVHGVAWQTAVLYF